MQARVEPPTLLPTGVPPVIARSRMTLRWIDRLQYFFSGRNRRKKFETFMRVFQPTPQMRVLDVGASEEERSDTDNLIERLYPHPASLTALSVEKLDTFRRRYPSIAAHVYDGNTFPFSDRSFDVCWSNAVLEHVGDHDRQVLFLKEVLRVARNGFITTPNRFFPVEVHTRTPLVHYLSKPTFDWYLKAVGKGWAADEYMYLLSYDALRKVLVDAGIERWVVKRNYFLGFTVDFVVMFGEKFSGAHTDEETSRDTKTRRTHRTEEILEMTKRAPVSPS